MHSNSLKTPTNIVCLATKRAAVQAATNEHQRLDALRELFSVDVSQRMIALAAELEQAASNLRRLQAKVIIAQRSMERVRKECIRYINEHCEIKESLRHHRD